MSDRQEPLKRAVRRWHRQRTIAHAERVAKGFGMGDADGHEWALQNARNLAVCSCWMCGNRREWDGETMQERRHAAIDTENA